MKKPNALEREQQLANGNITPYRNTMQNTQSLDEFYNPEGEIQLLKQPNKMKKHVKIILWACVAVLIATGIIIHLYIEGQREQARIEYERAITEFYNGRIKIRYGRDMRFQFRFVLAGGEIVISDSGAGASSRFINLHRQNLFPDIEIIFVHSEEEAAGFPDNVITAWPTDTTDGIIAGLHWAVSRDEDDFESRPELGRSVFSLEDFGLLYPLTPADLVNDWENVHALWNAFNDNVRSHINWAAPDGGPRTDETDESGQDYE
jgi:hypothetical protein